MTYQEWLLNAAVYWQHNEYQREGQAHWNSLQAHRPEIVDRITLTLSDPFYDDTRLPAFFRTVEALW